jgi:hypothetical protein
VQSPSERLRIANAISGVSSMITGLAWPAGVATARARQPLLKNVFGSQPDTLLANCQVVSVHVPNVSAHSLEKVA